MGIGDMRSSEHREILHPRLDLALRLLRRTDDIRGENGEIPDRFLDGGSHVSAPAAIEGCGLQPPVVSVVRRGGDIDRVRTRLFKGDGVLHAFLKPVAFSGLAYLVVALVDAEADYDGIILAAGFLDAFQDIGDEAQSVLETAAVLVRALVGVGAQELLEQIAVRGVQFDAVHARFLAAHRGFDELADELFDLAVRKAADMPARHFARLALGGTGRGEHQPFRDHLLAYAGRHLVDEFREILAELGAEIGERDHVDHDADVLPAGMVELHEKARSVPLYPVRHLAHGLYVIVVRHRELIERRRAVVVVDAGDLGDDEPGAALGALLVVVHEHLGRTAVGLTEPHHHGRHDYPVFDLERPNPHGRKQHFIFLLPDLCVFHIFSLRRKPPFHLSFL